LGFCGVRCRRRTGCARHPRRRSPGMRRGALCRIHLVAAALGPCSVVGAGDRCADDLLPARDQGGVARPAVSPSRRRGPAGRVMRVAFRPLPLLSVACAVLFTALMALGVWQLERLSWKRALITTVASRIAAPPVALDQALAMCAGAQDRRVHLAGRFDNAKEAYVFGTGVEGAPVFHVIVPFADDG